MSTGGLLPHKYPLYLIEAPYVFTIYRWTRRELCVKYLGKSYNQPELVMARMNNLYYKSK